MAPLTKIFLEIDKDANKVIKKKQKNNTAEITNTVIIILKTKKL